MPNDDVVRQLTELAEMHTSGLLSDDEFGAAKERLLRSDGPPGPGPRPASWPGPRETTTGSAVPAPWPGPPEATASAGPVPWPGPQGTNGFGGPSSWPGPGHATGSPTSTMPTPDGGRTTPPSRPRAVVAGLVIGALTVLLVLVVLVATGYLHSSGPAVSQPLSPGVTVSDPAAFSDPFPAPTPLSPASGSEFSHYPRDTTLSWTPVDGATAYEVTVQFDGSPGNGAWTGASERVAGGATQYSFSFVGAQPGRWQVAAVDPAGRAGLPSEWSYFSYTR